MDLGKKHLQRSLLASSIAAIAAGAMSLSASAQEENTVVEEVVVTGIRQSLENAMDIKRDSQGVVDAISAEDIGKMPDTNLAESLQRITGVSIDRQNGEGSRVTVRGFGPDYNLVTLNGRQMPAANLNATSANNSRSFDFQNLASEAVSALEVHKTGKASLLTGGIGSNINIKTARPLDNPGLNASFGFKATTDTSNRVNSDTTPEISGIFSNTFWDDKVGVSLATSYQERNSGFNTAEVASGWNSSRLDEDNRASYTGTVNVNGSDRQRSVNLPSNGSIIARPQNFMYSFNDVQRKRTNALLTLQFAPTDTLTTTLDYAYSELDVEQQRQELNTWFQNDGLQFGTFTDVNSDGVAAYTEYGDLNCCDFGSSVGSWGTFNENNSVGLNIEWRPSENLTLSLDYHDSTAESGAKDPRLGTNNVLTAANYSRAMTTLDLSGDFPSYAIYSDTNTANHTPTRADQIIGSGISFRNGYMKTDIEQLRFDGAFEFDEGVVESVDFGFTVSETNNRSAFALREGGDWGGVGYRGHAEGNWNASAGDEDNVYDDSLFEFRDVASEFDELSSGDAIIPQYVHVDFDGFLAASGEFLHGFPGQDWGDCDEGTLCARQSFTTDRQLTEEQMAVYTQVNFAWEAASYPMTLSVGLRYEGTGVASKSAVPNFVGQRYDGDNQFTLVQDGEMFETGTGFYDYLLPNLDFSVDFTDDIVARASYSKTLTRPTYANLQAGKAPGNTQARLAATTAATGGDPGLLPFVSDNLDFSAEWYYGEASYISLGYYSKSVKNFVGIAVTNEILYDNVVQPGSGARYAEALAAVQASGSSNISQDIRTYYGDQGWIDGQGNFTDGTSFYDPLVFAVSSPVNEKEASISGFEFAVQHLFGESGFGTTFNLTTVSGDVEYDNSVINENQFALLGLSDSANLVGFYDKGGIQVRLAYNWRDSFLNSTTQGNNQQEPIYTEAFGQLDLNASYDITDNLTGFVEAINLTESSQRLHGRRDEMLTFYSDGNARYNVGVRYSF